MRRISHKARQCFCKTTPVPLKETSNKMGAQQESEQRVCAAHKRAACACVRVRACMLCLLNDLRLLLNGKVSNQIDQVLLRSC